MIKQPPLLFNTQYDAFMWRRSNFDTSDAISLWTLYQIFNAVMTSFASNQTESLLSLGPLRPSIVLPQEILIQIFSYQLSQSTLHACTLVSTCWYAAAVKPLYTNPRIVGKNFEPFTNTVCPSINSHIRTNGLAGLIKRLDLSLLVHHGSKSLTARLLGRVKGNLEEFVAPQTSFACVCLIERCEI